MANDTISRQKWGFFSAIGSFCFGTSESKDIKKVKKNVAILLQNQNIQQLFVETIAQVTNITQIHSAKN